MSATIGVVGLAAYTAHTYRAPYATAEQTVIIPPHTGAGAVVAQLHEAGLVPPSVITLAPLFLSGNMHALKAGEYAFAAGMSPQQVIAKIVRGDIVIHKLTIPEGWNAYQVRDALLKEPLLTGELLPIAEGSILPDTIHFQRGETRSAVVLRMQKEQHEWMAKAWPARSPNLPFQTPDAALVLASIVEKETGVNDEREKVAGVFVNRLTRGMMLQSDPTVVYGVEARQGGAPMGRALTRGDLQTDTPYNSYTRVGLPPTPICHPGKAAILAVLHPAMTDALYFVATGHGGHHFAATLKEHAANVAAYRAALAGAKK